MTGDGLIDLAGVGVRFDAAGVLHWPDEGLVAVADLHLEKGSSAARRGRFVPPYDSRATLAALAATLDRLEARTVIALGDSFHDGDAGGRLAPTDLDRLEAMIAGRDWVWIAGNHDPEPPVGIGGRCAVELAIGPLVFRHEPRPGRVRGEVAGHLHPAARVGSGRVVRRRAFASDGARVVLPAFGAYTGGLNILDPAFAGLFERSRLVAWMIGETRVYPVRVAALRPD